jgi:hypothetical protein
MIGGSLYGPGHEGVGTVGTDDQPGVLGHGCPSSRPPTNPRGVVVVQQDLLDGEIFAYLRPGGTGRFN